MQLSDLAGLNIWSTPKAQRDNEVAELRGELAAAMAERDALQAQVDALAAQLAQAQQEAAQAQAARADMVEMYAAEYRRVTHGKHQ